MAEQEKGRWVTMRGRRVFIKDGETPTDAINRQIANNNQDIRDKQIAKAKEEADRLNGKKKEFPTPKHEPFSIAKENAALGLSTEFDFEDWDEDADNDIENPFLDERFQEFFDKYYGKENDVIFLNDDEHPFAKVIDYDLKNGDVYFITEDGDEDHYGVDDIYFYDEVPQLLKQIGWSKEQLDKHIKDNNLPMKSNTSAYLKEVQAAGKSGKKYRHSKYSDKDMHPADYMPNSWFYEDRR